MAESRTRCFAERLEDGRADGCSATRYEVLGLRATRVLETATDRRRWGFGRNVVSKRGCTTENAHSYSR